VGDARACPLCGSQLHRAADEVVWRCENTSCPAKLQRGLEHFRLAGAMNIEGLGESLVAQLIAQGLVTDYADVYALTVPQLAGLTSSSTRTDGKVIERRFGEKNAAKVAEQIERSKQADLWRVIFGLGMRHVGERAAQVLARRFHTMAALAAAPPASWRRRTKWARCWRPRSGLVRRAPQHRADRAAGAAGVRMEVPEERGGLLGRRATRGLHYVLTGTLTSMTREGRGGGTRIPGRQSVRAPSAGRPPRWWWAPRPGSKADKARGPGVPMLDESRVPRSPRSVSAPIMIRMTRRFLALTVTLTATVAFLVGLIVAGRSVPRPRTRLPNRHSPRRRTANATVRAGDCVVCRRGRAAQPGGGQHRRRVAGSRAPSRRFGMELPDGPRCSDVLRAAAREGPRRGAGTGFIIDRPGAHPHQPSCDRGRRAHLVRLSDGRTCGRRPSAPIPDTDIALIKVDAPER
jgi:hypothetical protein